MHCKYEYWQALIKYHTVGYSKDTGILSLSHSSPPLLFP